MTLKNHTYDNSTDYHRHTQPGHELLPPFGYCEMIESAKDIHRSRANHHKFVCEISQNILNQYALILIWFVLILAFVVSVFGLLILLLHHLIALLFIPRRNKMVQKLCTRFSLREYEYLEFLRGRNIFLYGEVLNRLKEDNMLEHDMSNDSSFPCDTPPPEFEVATRT